MTAGLMLAHAYPKILKMTIPAMMGKVDFGVVTLNNADEETVAACYEMAPEYRGNLFIYKSKVEHPPYTDRKRRLHWWRKTRVHLRSEAWENMKTVATSYFEGLPDVAWWPDADELPNASFDAVMEKFVDSDYEAVALKPVDVYGSMDMAKGWSMAPHCRIYKRVPEIDITKRGYRKAGRFHPIGRNRVMSVRYATVHLPYLFREYRKDRYENWKRPDFSDDERVRDRGPFNGLWKLPKPADQCTSCEIKAALTQPMTGRIRE